jgi:hypothetical protein
MNKPPTSANPPSPADSWPGSSSSARTSGNGADLLFGRALLGATADSVQESPVPPSISSVRIEPDEVSAEELPAGFSELAKKLTQTNALVDRAIATLTADDVHDHTTETLSELGESLRRLFSELDQGGVDAGHWQHITTLLNELAVKIEHREQLRIEVKNAQHAIDKTKIRLIEKIQDAARVEQERLSVTRMRSRLAAVMAEKLMNKLR